MEPPVTANATMPPTTSYAQRQHPAAGPTALLPHRKRTRKLSTVMFAFICGMVVGSLGLRAISTPIQVVLASEPTLPHIHERMPCSSRNATSTAIDKSPESDKRTGYGPIPHQFILVDTRYKKLEDQDDLAYKNIQKTIHHYRGAWQDPEAPVLFFGDKECQEAIRSIDPRLLQSYQREEQGRFKSDICRIAALVIHGGYYFDSDMVSVEPFLVDKATSFVTGRQWGNDGFYNSFVASVPQHPVLDQTLDVMLMHYRNLLAKLKTHMGPATLKMGYEVLQPKDRGKTYLLFEMKLEDNPDYDHFPRQNGTGCCCNFVLEDRAESKIHFYSRMVGWGKYCRFTETLEKNTTKKTLHAKRTNPVH